VGNTAIGAFLEVSLHGESAYRAFFRRPMAGRGWLPPDDIYLVRSSDDAFVLLNGVDPSRRPDGATVMTTGFESERSTLIPLRALLPDQGSRATELRWSAGGSQAAWEVSGLATTAATVRPTAVRVALANGALTGESNEPLDLLVELATRDGVTVALPLSRWGALPPPLETDLTKDHLVAGLSSMDLAAGAPVERVLQTYDIPLADYAAVEPAFVPARLSAIRIVVDRATSGALWVAEVGLVHGR
jgi:hypothetical protein